MSAYRKINNELIQDTGKVLIFKGKSKNIIIPWSTIINFGVKEKACYYITNYWYLHKLKLDRTELNVSDWVEIIVKNGIYIIKKK